MEEKCLEKLELMHDTQAMVYCSDNDIVSRCIRRMQYKGEKIAWSQCDEQAALFVKEIKSLTSHLSPLTSRITYIYDGEENSFEIPFIDEASIENAITCAAVALRLGLTPAQLGDRMPKLDVFC